MPILSMTDKAIAGKLTEPTYQTTGGEAPPGGGGLAASGLSIGSLCSFNAQCASKACDPIEGVCYTPKPTTASVVAPTAPGGNYLISAISKPLLLAQPPQTIWEKAIAAGQVASIAQLDTQCVAAGGTLTKGVDRYGNTKYTCTKAVKAVTGAPTGTGGREGTWTPPSGGDAGGGDTGGGCPVGIIMCVDPATGKSACQCCDTINGYTISADKTTCVKTEAGAGTGAMAAVVGAAALAFLLLR